MMVPNDPSTFTFQGLCCAVHSPMNDDLSLNLDAVEPTAKHLVETHVNGAFVCGTTGESMLLSVEERKLVNSKIVELPIASRKVDYCWSQIWPLRNYSYWS